MARVAAIGEELRVQGFGLAGAVVCPARGRTEVHAAWHDLADDVVVVVLTAAAATALADTPPVDILSGRRLTVVMPE